MTGLSSATRRRCSSASRRGSSISSSPPTRSSISAILRPCSLRSATALTADGLFAFSVETFRGRRVQARADDAVRSCARLRRDDRARGGLAAAPRPVGVDAARSGRGRARPDLRVREDLAARTRAPLRPAATNSRARGTPAARARSASPRRSAADRPSGNGRRNRTGPGRREPAIGELPASRIAERPPAGEFANLLEPQPSHLSDLGFAKGPGRLPVPGSTRGSRARTAAALWLGAELTDAGIVAHCARRAPARVLPDAAARPPPLSLIPIRLALPMTALRDPTPSAAAMPLALFPSRASLLRSSTASAVHSIAHAPMAIAAAFAAATEWS